jgi:hypothetical protein
MVMGCQMIAAFKDSIQVVRPAEYKSLLERNGFQVVATGTREVCQAILEELPLRATAEIKR